MKAFVVPKTTLSAPRLLTITALTTHVLIAATTTTRPAYGHALLPPDVLRVIEISTSTNRIRRKALVTLGAGSSTQPIPFASTESTLTGQRATCS
jgi:hypothetical protein